jgi:hypothetical protein
LPVRPSNGKEKPGVTEKSSDPRGEQSDGDVDSAGFGVYKRVAKALRHAISTASSSPIPEPCLVARVAAFGISVTSGTRYDWRAGALLLRTGDPGTPPFLYQVSGLPGIKAAFWIAAADDSDVHVILGLDQVRRDLEIAGVAWRRPPLPDWVFATSAGLAGLGISTLPDETLTEQIIARCAGPDNDRFVGTVVADAIRYLTGQAPCSDHDEGETNGPTGGTS